MPNNIVEIDIDNTVVIETTDTDIVVVDPIINLVTLNEVEWGFILGDINNQTDLFEKFVVKSTGKGLSTNDFTDAFETKLSNIEENAEVNVNADWDSISGDSEILNKPFIPTALSELSDDENHRTVTDTEKTKLSSIETGAEVNVQADWNAVSGDAFINNKPTIPTNISELADDTTHRTVTDTEKSTWNAKQPAGTYSTDIHANITALNAVTNVNTGDQDLSNLVVKETGKGLSTNDYTTDDKNKLSGIETGAEVNVQADWSVTDTNSDAYIKNKMDTLSGGACVKPTYTDNGNGTLTVNASTVSLYDNTSFLGYPKCYNIAQITPALTDVSTNYIIADYNAGTPIIRVTLNVTEITESNIIPLFTIYRNGNYLHTLDWDTLGRGLVNKIHQSIVKTQRYRRESGLAISESGTRNVNVTLGKVWLGANGVDLTAIASVTDNMFLWYHSAGVWTQSVVTQYNNTQYDNGTNLATLSNGRYAVNWIFRGVENPKHLYVVLGNGDFTQSNALSSLVPTLPPAISSHAVLIGRILVVKSSNTAYAIQSAFDTTFVTSPISVHDDLSGLNTGEYKHLTSSEYTGVVNNSIFVSPADLKGGTSDAYQSVVISSYPYIVKKFLNATTNTAYFDLNLSELKSASQIRYRVKYILTESTVPTVGLTTIFGTLGTTVTKTYAGTETQNTIITSDWSSLVNYSNTNTLTVTGTYAQKVGILFVEVEYSRGV